MTITINWSVSSMDCAANENGRSNVVKAVHWRCDGANTDAAGSAFGVCQLGEVSGDFIPYENLTMQAVLAWVWSSGLEKATIEASVRDQIEKAKSPLILSLPPPWEPKAKGKRLEVETPVDVEGVRFSKRSKP